MAKTQPSTDGCKGSFSETSRIKHLPLISSPIAASLSAGFFAVTCFVLFKDVADGASITTDHVMSFAVLVGTFASGHLLSEQLRQRHLLPAAGLALLFCAGTFYCVTASGGRNAASSGAKAELVHKDNDDRARIEADLSVAKDRLKEAQDKEADECASGEGSKCRGRRVTRQERQTYVNVLEAQLRLMDPAKSEYPELRHAAKVFASVVSASEQTIFDRLVLWFPFVKALFCEIATLVFGAIGFAHRRYERPSLPERAEPVDRKAERVTLSTETLANILPFHRKQPTAPVPLSKSDALADLLSLGSVPSQEALAKRWHRSEATVSRWVRAWEAENRVSRQANGRSMSLRR